jgi:hypothetical protein
MFYRGLTSNTSLREVFHKVNNTHFALFDQVALGRFFEAKLESFAG